MSCYGSPDGEPDDALLRERGVEDSVDTVLFHKTGSAAKDSSEFDVLSEYLGAEWVDEYVWSVSRAISMAELTAWKRLRCVL